MRLISLLLQRSGEEPLLSFGQLDLLLLLLCGLNLI